MPRASDDREVFAGDNGIRNAVAPAILTHGFIICDSTSLQSEMSTLKFLRRLFPVAAFLGGFVWDALTIGQRGTWTMTVNLPANVVFYDSIITDAMPDGFDLAGLSIDSITCTNWVGACPTSLSALSPSGTGNRTIGWSVGYLPSSTLTRTLVVSYKATVTDIAGNVAGVNRQNTASFKWNLAAAPTPPTSSGMFMA